MPQADTVILTNQNQRSEDPHKIILDICTGYPPEIQDSSARRPWTDGFLQDPVRVPWTAREFVWEHQNR